MQNLSMTFKTEIQALSMIILIKFKDVIFEEYHDIIMILNLIL